MGRGPVAIRRPLPTLLSIAVAVVAADQATKALVRVAMAPNASVPVVPGVLWLTHVRNTGAAFGLLSGAKPVFIATSLAVLVGVGLVWWRYRPRGPVIVTALALVCGGAFGNLIDRVVFGRVTDYFDVHFFPVFNVADSAIVIGVALLIGWLLLHEDAEDAEVPEPDAGEGGARP